jgi:endonuclease/exonuclease/phosphatase (EEP) superfamily protein YafD
MVLLPVSSVFTDTPAHFPTYFLPLCLFISLLVFFSRLPVSWVAPVAAAAGIFASQLYPYILPARGAAPAGVSFTVLQANILYTNTDLSKLETLIRDVKPDVVALAEINDAVPPLAERLKDDYPHYRARGDAALLSRLALEDITLKEPANGSAQPVVASVTVDGQDVVLATFHAAIPLQYLSRRDGQFRDMAQTYKDTFGNTPPRHFVFMGDINSTPYAPAMRKLSRDIRVVNARQGHGIHPTWPVWLHESLRIPIDHILVSPAVHVADFKTGPDIGSDHLPTIATLVFTRP